ncbi:MAG: transposase [Chloroflexi bacterium]|nr:transposase [Chloroflexota bacterium]
MGARPPSRGRCPPESRRRSSSAIDRPRTGGRRGHLFESVTQVPKGGPEPVACPPQDGRRHPLPVYSQYTRGPSSPSTRRPRRTVSSSAWTRWGRRAPRASPATNSSPHDAQTGRAIRATQEIDDGRRGAGDVFGAFKPAAGEAFTAPYPSRSAANWADFLDKVDAWLPPEVERVYGIVDHLSAHRAIDMLLFALARPQWEFVFQPTYAASRNLIEPWWKVPRSLALKGRRFETWVDIVRAVAAATAYWNAHKHPFRWGRRRRRRIARPAGIAALPKVA